MHERKVTVLVDTEPHPVGGPVVIRSLSNSVEQEESKPVSLDSLKGLKILEVSEVYKPNPFRMNGSPLFVVGGYSFTVQLPDGSEHEVTVSKSETVQAALERILAAWPV